MLLLGGPRERDLPSFTPSHPHTKLHAASCRRHPPGLLYLLFGDSSELAQATRTLRALPFELAVQVFDDPELTGHRCAIVQHMDESAVAPLVEAMSADQQADLFRELPPADRRRFLETLALSTQQMLTALLAYRPETAGGIMTTEFVAVPTDWTVAQTLDHIRTVGRAKATVYPVDLHDPATQALTHTVSLRELMVADPARPVSEAGDLRVPLSVPPTAEREDAARIVSKYNLLALPVVDEDRRMLGIVTVDDVIDELVREVTEDVQNFGGMEALGEHRRLRSSSVRWRCVR